MHRYQLFYINCIVCSILTYDAFSHDVSEKLKFRREFLFLHYRQEWGSSSSPSSLVHPWETQEGDLMSLAVEVKSPFEFLNNEGEWSIFDLFGHNSLSCCVALRMEILN